MKTPIHLLFLLLFCVASCKGQRKAEPLPDTQSVFMPDFLPSDNDPYFTETQDTFSITGPGSITRNILQDRNGHFWLASWEGIIRYDGKTFTNFTNKDGLRRYHVFSLLEDRKGHLWFGTIGAGVYRYYGQTFTNFTTKNGLASDRVGCIFEDNSGNIWVGTDGGLSVYDGQSFTSFTEKDGLCNNDINSILQDPDGKLWLGTRGSTCYYDGKKFVPFTRPDGKELTNMRTVIKDSNGHILIGGGDGLWRFDGEQYTCLSTDFVGYMIEDRTGNLWYCAGIPNSHNMALYRFDKPALSAKTPQPFKIYEEPGMIFGLLEDTQGNIWFGTGEGVCRYDGVRVERL